MRSLFIVSACVCALSLSSAARSQGASGAAAAASAPGMLTKSAEVSVKAKIVELDKARRSVVLQGPQGKLFTLDVPPEVKNFAQVQVGDELSVRYVAALAAKLEPVGKSSSGVRERSETLDTDKAAAGAMPGIGASRTVEALAVIESVDSKARKVVLRGARRSVTLDLPADMDIGKLKAGMDVRAIFIEAAVISVEPAPAK